MAASDGSCQCDTSCSRLSIEYLNQKFDELNLEPVCLHIRQRTQMVDISRRVMLHMAAKVISRTRCSQ